ncbi:MAG: hypothetical protein MJ106_01565 [Lentisphaeria bacterium]|nr:hypothetical protein [Lentisphaeria bacterium]
MNKLLSSIFLSLLACTIFAQQQPTEDDGIGLSQEVMQKLLDGVNFRDQQHTARVTRCRGTYLRTEIRDTSSEYALQAEIKIVGDDRQPAFVLKKIEHKTLTEVRIYEALLRIFTPGKDDDHGTYDYERLDGETWEGESNQRVITQDAGPLADTDVMVNGILLKTDANGIIHDTENQLNILDKFDDLGIRLFDFTIDVPGFDPINIPLTRTMPQRRQSDEMRIEEDEKFEILLAYGLDFALSKKKPEQDALQCKATLPKDFAFATAGEAFPLTITVTNSGETQTSCLVARSFSRIDGLDGKLFYFGAIQPGETKSFTRILRVDENEKSNAAALEIRFSDSWSLPKQRIPLRLTLIH